MKRTLVGVLLVALWSSHAHADERETWRAVLAGSITLTVSGGVLIFYGNNLRNDAADELCDRGAYPFDPSCPTEVTLTAGDVDRLNNKGERGANIAKVGALTLIIGGALTGFSAYKLITAKPRREPAVAVTPTVSGDGAGAQLLLRW